MKKTILFVVIVSFVLTILAWCTNTSRIQPGDTIALVYTATYSDWSLFDQNTKDNPLIFTVGSGHVIQWLDEAVIGMKVGKSKNITITPDKGYGKLYQSQYVQKIGKLIFDTIWITPETGKMIQLDQINWYVKGIETDEQGNSFVLFDINPRQTRDTLTYTITVIDQQQ